MIKLKILVELNLKYENSFDQNILIIKCTIEVSYVYRYVIDFALYEKTWWDIKTIQNLDGTLKWFNFDKQKFISHTIFC